MSAPDLVELASRGTVHFMGICGAGMSPLAELLLRSGGRVSGCDARPCEAAPAGVEVEVGHDPAHVREALAVVVTAAVPAEHPELQAARARGIPVLKRAEALAAVVNRGQVVAVAGTHGKTTTSALTASVLAAAGLDPTALVGGRVVGWRGNYRSGGDRLFVVEADEYDRSFLKLQPTLAVVTTLEADHLDTYGSLSAIEDAFYAFGAAVPVQGGAVLACGDDHGVGRLLPRLATAGRRVVTYGLAAGAMLRAERVTAHGATTRFVARERARVLGRATLQVPGLHNVRNALAAVAVARELGAEWAQIAEGLAAYRGVGRRFERIGEAAGVLLIDDYAHHPTEIAATLAAARSAYPRRRLVAVFQPHLYSRTRDFAREFGQALAAADRVFVTAIYPAREAPIAGVGGELVAAAAETAGARVVYLPERDAVAARVAAELRAGDVCLTLGAGDLDHAARELLARLGALAAA